ncbi:hypothetical protein EIP91_011314 [Steccherinum ochraceum]|uniref:F-box domain-containing protein n=1 Tax=Steccherinum ochraceum TaxID=92696 RepID=A0A4R0RQ01_9APHY|nr:hypothetical protein EIP91_011314 [Steccherinum ochraceum]
MALSRTSRRGHLPRELKDMIFNHLDKETFATCTLLAREGGWHVSARSHLFKQIVIFDRLKNFTHNLSTFRDFISSAPTNTVENTKDLTICGEDGSDCELTPLDIQFLLSKLPVLRTLWLKHVWLKISPAGPQPSHSRKAFFALHLHHVYLDLQADLHGVHGPEALVLTQCSFVDLLDLFSSLKTLDLQNVEFTWHSALEDENPHLNLIHRVAHEEGKKLRSSYALENLSLMRSTPNVFIFLSEFLRITPILHNLHRLETQADGELYYDRFVEHLGPRLQHLQITLHTANGLSNYQVTNCPRLSSLQFTTLVLCDDQARVTLARHREIALLLNSALKAPTTVVSLTLEIRVIQRFFWPTPEDEDPNEPASILSDIATPSLNEVDSALSQRHRLRKLTIVLEEVMHPDRSEPVVLARLHRETELLKHKLPLLDAKGMLAFQLHIRQDFASYTSTNSGRAFPVG